MSSLLTQSIHTCLSSRFTAYVSGAFTMARCCRPLCRFDPQSLWWLHLRASVRQCLACLVRESNSSERIMKPRFHCEAASGLVTPFRGNDASLDLAELARLTERPSTRIHAVVVCGITVRVHSCPEEHARFVRADVEAAAIRFIIAGVGGPVLKRCCSGASSRALRCGCLARVRSPYVKPGQEGLLHCSPCGCRH